VRRIAISALSAVVLLATTACGTARQSTGLNVPPDWTRPAATAPQAAPVAAPAWRYAVLMHAGWLTRDLDGGQASAASLAALGLDAYALQVDGKPTGTSRSYSWELATIRAVASSTSSVPVAMRYAIARKSAVAVLRQLASSSDNHPA
jgi:hypothetical protein